MSKKPRRVRGLTTEERIKMSRPVIARSVLAGMGKKATWRLLMSLGISPRWMTVSKLYDEIKKELEQYTPKQQQLMIEQWEKEARKKTMWRLVLNVNAVVVTVKGPQEFPGIPIHWEYHSLRVACYAEKREDLCSKEELIDIAMREIENYTGYSYLEWWFAPIWGFEPPEELEYDKSAVERRIDIEWEVVE